MTNTPSRWDPKILARSLRIITGLFLLAFVTSHLLNASLGLISLEAMDAARPILTGVWSYPPLGQLLVLSLVAHFVLGLWSIYVRPSFKTNRQDIMQIVTALCVVPVMATHVIGIMMTDQFGLHMHYVDVIRLMWVDNPATGLIQVLVVTIVWLHGCAGLLIWLRSLEGAKNLLFWIYPFAIAVPVLALLGFSEAGRQVLETAASGAGSAPSPSPDQPRPQVDFAFIKSMIAWTIWGSAGLAAFTLLARSARLWLRPNAQVHVVRDGTDVGSVRSAGSLLDAFREHDEPHASLCQGRGRCGTCAVEIISSEFPLRDPSALERQTLSKKGLPEGARLACQVFPDAGNVTVKALYPADYSYHNVDDQDEPSADAAPSQQGEVTP